MMNLVYKVLRNPLRPASKVTNYYSSLEFPDAQNRSILQTGRPIRNICAGRCINKDSNRGYPIAKCDIGDSRILRH